MRRNSDNPFSNDAKSFPVQLGNRPAAAPATTIKPRNFEPRTVRIIGARNGAGLSRDREILQARFIAIGWRVIEENAKEHARVNIHLENITTQKIDAGVNIVIPNPECWNRNNNGVVRESNIRVWAKTEDAANIFRKLGATVSTIGFSSLDRKQDTTRERAFLHLAGNSLRKGTKLLLRTWRKEWPQLTVIAKREELLRARGLPPNVSILKAVDATALQQLQNQHIFHIYPSSYEGFGHAQWEGLSCGAIVFIPKEAPPFNEWPAVFARLSVISTSLRATPNRLAEDYDIAPEEITTAVEFANSLTDADINTHSDQARQSWEQNREAFIKAVDREIKTLDRPIEITGGVNVRQVITLHSAKERCGITEYGRALDEALAAEEIRPTAHRLTNTTAIRQLGRDQTAFVHFEPSLVTSGTESALLEARKRGAKIVFCCHFFDANIATWYRNITDVFVLHRQYTGAPANAKIIPLGCPIYEDDLPDDVPQDALRERLGLPKDRTILTTAGLLSAWKEIPKTINALLTNIQSNENAHNLYLQILTPPPIQSDRSVEAHLRAVLQRYNEPGNRVFLSTAFLPAREVLDRLRATDIGFVYHGQNTNSVSAAVRQFTAVRRPLVITRSSHSSDLRAGALRVGGFDVIKFADAVRELARDPTACGELRTAAVEEYKRINMQAVAKQYVELFRSL